MQWPKFCIRSVCVRYASFSCVMADSDTGYSPWAGWEQLPLSDVIEEVIDHFPQDEDARHTASLTLIVYRH